MRFLRPLLLLILAAAAPGCGRDPAVRLVLISPHRDEVRIEFGQAFQEWLKARAAERLDAARASCDRFQKESTPAAVDAAVGRLCADWRPDDLGGIPGRRKQFADNPGADTAKDLRDALDRWHRPPVELVWQDVGGGTSSIAKYLNARFDESPDGIGLDVFFGGGTDVHDRLADEKRLLTLDLPPALLERIPQDLHGVPLYDPKHRWFGPMISSFGILSNRRVLERIGQPEPNRWADLGAPGMAGWVSAGDPRMSGSVHMVYEIVLQGSGWDEGFRQLLRIGANTHSFLRDSGVLTRTVSTGEVAAAGNVDANALTAVGNDPGWVTYTLPPRETIINADAIAVFRGAPQPGLATAFVEFTLSDEGQSLLLLQPGQTGGPKKYPVSRLSVVESLYRKYPPDQRSIGAVNPFTLGDVIHYNSTVGRERWDGLNDLFGAVVVDAHTELTGAWEAVRRLAGSPDQRARLERELFAPPCSEHDLKEYVRLTKTDGPRYRTVTINRWGEEARQRYRSVRRAAGNP